MASRKVVELSGSPADHRKRLETLRDQLHDAIAVASPNMLPQLAGQYRATLAELSALPDVAGGVVKKRDELAERRKNRGAVAATVPTARKRGGQRRG